MTVSAATRRGAQILTSAHKRGSNAIQNGHLSHLPSSVNLRDLSVDPTYVDLQDMQRHPVPGVRIQNQELLKELAFLTRDQPWALDTRDINDADDPDQLELATDVRFGTGPFNDEHRPAATLSEEGRSEQRHVSSGSNYTGATLYSQRTPDLRQFVGAIGEPIEAPAHELSIFRTDQTTQLPSGDNLTTERREQQLPWEDEARGTLTVRVSTGDENRAFYVVRGGEPVMVDLSDAAKRDWLQFDLAEPSTGA